jgi:hypothetical protein
MDKKTKIILVIVLIIGLFYISKNLFSNKEADLFQKKQECSKNYDLVNQKIKDSGRIMSNESYTLNEIFYSPKMNTCLYAYTIHTGGGEEIYSIYDVFGGDIFGGSLSDEFQKERTKLKQ